MSQLKDILAAVMAIDPQAPAIEFEGRWHSWGELATAGAALEAVLDAAGLGPGTRVAGLLRNHVRIIPAVQAVVGSGRCIATLNPHAPDDKLAADIRALKAPVLVALAIDWARPDIRAAAADIGCLGIEMTLDPALPVRLVDGLERVRGADLNREATGVGIEMLTSGTTGTPKRVPLKLANFERMMMETAIYEAGRQKDAAPVLRSGVQIMNTPFSHIGGIMSCFGFALAGRKGCLLDRFNVGSFVDAVRRHRPKTASAPPSALRMLLDADVPKEALSSLVVFRTATAPLDPALADAFTEKYGIPVLQNYGATEFAGGVAGWTLPEWQKYGRDKRGSVGNIHKGIDARITDPDSGEELPHGAQGVLELRAPHLGNGKDWVKTTDLAVLDADRYLWIKGRADNAIIRGGFKVLPDDVVNAMQQHPAIREASVVGLPDPRLGQVPGAAYILKANAPPLGEDEMRTFLREKLMPYQVPVVLKQMDEFPRTPSMKVSQPDLRRLLEA